MEPLYYIWFALQAAVGFHLVFPWLLYFFYILKGAPRGNPAASRIPGGEADYAIIVTAYQQTDQLPEVIASLLALRYSNFHIYVVADNCDPSGLQLAHPKVRVLRPETVLAGNVKSHFYAIEHFIRDHQRLVIIDSDNLADPELLHELNLLFDEGFEAVQGVRNPKNLDTVLARLDAARDIYYHFFDGRILFRAGSSATLAGSGMAFTVPLYRRCLENRPVEGAGFDKVLQAALVGLNYRIAFAEKAVVLDEKTKAADQLVGQRARWINTWFRYFGYGFGLVWQGLTRPSWNQLLFGLVLLRPPLFIFLFLSVCFAFVNLFIHPLMTVVWAGALILFVLGFVLALAKSGADRRIYAALRQVPRFVFYQMQALWRVRKANRLSVATRHGDSLRDPDPSAGAG